MAGMCPCPWPSTSSCPAQAPRHTHRSPFCTRCKAMLLHMATQATDTVAPSPAPSPRPSSIPTLPHQDLQGSDLDALNAAQSRSGPCPQLPGGALEHT